jgi:hypothetical protein
VVTLKTGKEEIEITFGVSGVDISFIPTLDKTGDTCGGSLTFLDGFSILPEK